MTQQQPFVVYAAKCRGNAMNTEYPLRMEITDAETARKAFSRDTVFAEYEGNCRAKDNFIRANCLPLDCDNEHSDKPEDWLTEKDIERMFPGVPYILHFSRHHMAEKKNASARPRFHVIFQIHPTENPDEYAELKNRAVREYPFFDDGAKDIGRFFFGTEDPKVIFKEGTVLFDEFLQEDDPWAFAGREKASIPEGSRHKTMCKIAATVIKRYGETDDAHDAYIAESERCSPPLEDAELDSIWGSAKKFYKEKVMRSPGYIPPEVYNAPPIPTWEMPIPFDELCLPEFPVEALPSALRDYVTAVAESTQTSPDRAAVASLAVVAICSQGKYVVFGKPDWSEPVNLFTVIIAPPAERKSAVMSLMVSPLEEYEKKVNEERSANIIESQMRLSVLERERKSLEDRAAKGKATREEITEKAKEIAEFRDVKPLKLFADDVTAEKLASVLAENNSRAAIVSPEGGIFDILKGIYTQGVNIDAILKGHSGDSIRVDRIGRPSETIPHPALTMLLAVQPEVLNGMMTNTTFRGRGLTARFLYAMPKSPVGRRAFDTTPISEKARERYASVLTMLAENEEYGTTPLQLSEEAKSVFKELFEKTETRLCGDLAEIADWAGKYVGAVLRISALLHLAENPSDFLEFGEISEKTMRNAVLIGEYFLEHAKAAYSLMGADPVNRQCEFLISAIKKNGLAEFSKRDAMRICRRFKTAEALQPVLNRLCEYGYIAPKATEPSATAGRRPSDTYLTNPEILSET